VTGAGAVAALGAMVLLGAIPASAGDGRLEINQTCALAGCFPGDSPGFPVTLGSDKSYVLTSSLQLSSASGIGIQVGARSTLDFQGFSLIGAITCSGGPPVSCSEFGASTGIVGAEGVVIRNGTVRGTTYAIRSGNGTRIEQMALERNSNDGIRADLGAEGWIVEGCAIEFNGGIGISLNYSGGSKGALIRNNKIRANGDYGIALTQGLVLENTITENVSLGVAGNQFGYGSNFLVGNDGGGDVAQVSNGQQIGQNVCGTNTTCP
jgi:hypothetical protein